jgi:hypothetical protein
MTGSQFSATPTVAWGYDALGQVTSADHPTAAKDFGYGYDAIGNRKRSVKNTTDTSTSVAANRTIYRSGPAVTSPEGGTALNQYTSLQLYGATGVTAVTYDVDGNQLTGPYATASMPGGTRTWDGENQLTQTAVTSGATTLYTYDAFHRRV